METTVEVLCPYCGEVVTVMIQMGNQRLQYHEDCEVCCQPLRVDIRRDQATQYDVSISRSCGH